MNTKIITMCALALCTFGLFGAGYQDVYTTKASLKVPYLKNGVRQYASQTLQGSLYVVYADAESSVDQAYMILTNKKTKVVHTIDFTDGFINMMGKSSGKIGSAKYAPRSTPTIYFTGADSDVTGPESHETIDTVSFAGSATTKDYKSTTVTCGYCSTSASSIAYCKKPYKMSGSVVGVMDCECPDEENWSHTLVKTLCGFLMAGEDEGEDENDERTEDVTADGLVRSHYASFWGTWTAVYNQKASGEVD